MTDQVPTSPFLPGTNIQFAEAYQIVERLLEQAYYINGCLECHLEPNAKGYSNIGLGGRNGIKLRAHRLVFFVIAKRILHPDEFVLHECDNRRCIHPLHLFEGSAQDNTDDMIAKGRNRDDPFVGERRRQATADRIRPHFLKGLSDDEIAEKLHLSKSTVWNYTRGPYRSSLAIPSGDEDTGGLG